MKKVIFYIYQFNSTLDKYCQMTEEFTWKLSSLEDVKALLNKRAALLKNLEDISSNIKEAIDEAVDSTEAEVQVSKKDHEEFENVVSERSALVRKCIDLDISLWRIIRKMETGKYTDYSSLLEDVDLKEFADAASQWDEVLRKAN